MKEQDLIKIALPACVDMIGKELVEEYKDNCGCCYGFGFDGMFKYSLLMQTKPIVYKMGDETPFEYAAHVIVNPETGQVKRDYNNSRLPQ